MSNTTKNIKTAFLLNLLFSIIELIGGFLTNSISIISDSIHDFGDAISIGIALLLEKKSNKAPDSKYTYGYLRYSLLGALITSIILFTGSTIMIYNAIIRLFNPADVNYNGMMFLAIIGVIINGVAAYRTSKSNNMNEKTINLHLLEDVLSWGAVLVGSVLMRIFDVSFIDPIMSLLISCYILFNVVKNVKKILAIFLDKAPIEISAEDIKKEILNDVRIIGVHHMHLWSMDSINHFATMHVIVNENINKKDIISMKHEIKHKLKHLSMNHVTIEFEYNGEKCEDINCNSKKNKLEHHTHNH